MADGATVDVDPTQPLPATVLADTDESAADQWLWTADRGHLA